MASAEVAAGVGTAEDTVARIAEAEVVAVTGAAEAKPLRLVELVAAAVAVAASSSIAAVGDRSRDLPSEEGEEGPFLELAALAASFCCPKN